MYFKGGIPPFLLAVAKFYQNKSNRRFTNGVDMV